MDSGEQPNEAAIDVARQRGEVLGPVPPSTLPPLARDQGKRERLASCFAPVYGWFTEG